MALDTADKQFISDLFDTKFEEKFEQKFGHYFGLLRDDFNHRFAILVEISKDKPGREEVREMIREETRYIVHDEMSKVFAPEVKEIRVKQKNHEKRIAKLEAAAA